MSNLCKNCNSETTDRYCAHCGQSTSTKRIDWSFCLKEFVFNNLTLHKGILYTIKSLILNPKKVVEDYLSGKRVGYTGAFHFFILVLIFKGVVALLNGGAQASGRGTVSINGISTPIDLQQYIRPMFYIFTAISSLGTYLVFKSRKLRLAEHFFLNFYIIGMCFLLAEVYNFVTFYRFPEFRGIFMAIVIISFYVRIFYEKKIRICDVLKGILCLTLNLFIALILLIIGALIFMIHNNMLDEAAQTALLF